MYTYIYVYVYIHIYIYICHTTYIYIYRERERETSGIQSRRTAVPTVLALSSGQANLLSKEASLYQRNIIPKACFFY